MNTKKVIYYAPVKKRMYSKWEFYKTDFDVLEEVFETVIVCHSFFDVVRNIASSDLVYCWWWHRSSLIVLLARLFRTKVFCTGALYMIDMSNSPDFYSKNFLYRLSTKISLKMADKNLFISKDQLRQTTVRLDVKNPVLHLSSLGKRDNFSIKDTLNQRERGKNSNPILVFTTICWHMPDQYKRKGVYETLDALAMYKQQTDFNFKWNIIGGAGIGVGDLRKKVHKLGLDENVNIIIEAKNKEKRKILFESDLYIQPSWCEGFGNAVLEAMSHGVPVIVSRYTAQPEVSGDNGLVLMEIDSLEIFKKICIFSSLTQIEKNILIKSTLERVEEKFTFSIRCSSFLDIYNKN
jgi:glycosyltransferase involved in cell wall biosynthesis